MSVHAFDRLASLLEGELFTTQDWRLMYATDASVYREIPLAVCRPRHLADLKQILQFARQENIPLIPRTAGTSLAGQVVGQGLVVDFSRHMNRIIELNTEEKWVKVEPGVILDDLNDFLKPHGLFFGPETSTSNRCMIGGMVANNSCGSHSMVYGSTRDHTLEVETLLSDGSQAIFGPLGQDAFRAKCIGNRLENQLYRQIFEMLSDQKNRQEIEREFPDKRLKRRNTGYAIDLLLDSAVFSETDKPFNFSTLLAGSEGSLALFTSIKLNLVPLPPANTAVVCVHVKTISESLQANLAALKHGPVAIELIDKVVLDCTKTSLAHKKNRFFLQGDPGAILVVEFAEEHQDMLDRKVNTMITDLRQRQLGYHYPVLRGGDIGKVWALRKAGLGLLSNVPGDAKPVAVIEDAAVHVEQLPDFIAALQQELERLRLDCVYYAHIGTGEIHLRPVLDLKNPADVGRFHDIAEATARLVKKFRGSLSGEHGDGRLRAEFIPLIIGDHNYALLKQLKKTWDPQGILNPGKITDAPPMKESLRYFPGQQNRKIKTYFHYDEAGSFIQAVEKCNGSGDCRKPHNQGGLMCPSYHATLDENASTRGRANILREFISHSKKKNPFDHEEIMQVLDLCLSCKGCRLECPSNVDMAKYKAEALQHYYQAHGTPLKARVIGAFGKMYQMGGLMPGLFNFMVHNSITSSLIKKTLGFAPDRSLPGVYKTSMRRWARHHLSDMNASKTAGRELYLFCDEFTNTTDTLTGIHAVELLHRLGYRVSIPAHGESGRSMISKGLLRRAALVAEENVRSLSPLVSQNKPLVGIEPSAILGFRDEYPGLLNGEIRQQAVELAGNCYTFEEFICRELDLGHIDQALCAEVFRNEAAEVYFHGHCHQKALSSADYSLRMMQIAPGIQVKSIDCGCCGMAGSFGYEKKNYALSMKVAELNLLPAIRQAPPEAIISASGTSCRHQISDGTGRKALHPVDVLHSRLR